MSNCVFILFSLDPSNDDARTSDDNDGPVVEPDQAQRMFSLVRVFFSYFL